MTEQEEVQKEMRDRLRRIETRLTSYLVKQGETVGGQPQPEWNDKEECVVVSALDCSLSKCMSVIPPELSGDVYIRTEDYRYIATIHIGGEK